MKTVITALNSKYIHMSLAPWYLKAACSEICDTEVLELTINQDKSEIIRRIYLEKPDIAAFSCYIFNIDRTREVIADLKSVLPNITIILGGPEVSYNAEDYLSRNPSADYIICGEGEERFKRLILALSENKTPSDIDGIAYRNNNQIIFNPPTSWIDNLDTVSSPYTDEMLTRSAGKIIYFEASRGCPFRCSYCLSSVSGGVRRFSFERIKNDLLKVMMSDARQVKFVDRTFNCNLSAAKQIVKFILSSAQSDKSGKIKAKNYHFEAAADLFDDELIDLLARAPKGLFQLEIGIQSFNEKTLEAVGRKTDLEICKKNIRKLLSAGSMHIHLDLIAGLPNEDFKSFAESFNRLFELRPHCIQLGFLKLLYGSKMRDDADNYGYAYSKLPPYEVLRTPWLDFDSILNLKRIETAVDSIYNKSKFNTSLTYIITKFSDYFNFFDEFSQFLNKFYPDGYGIPAKELYNFLSRFSREYLNDTEMKVMYELLKFDFYVSDNSCNPPTKFTHYEIPDVRSLYADFKGSKRRVHFERFSINPIKYCKNGEIEEGVFDVKFDYSERNSVTEHYNAETI